MVKRDEKKDLRNFGIALFVFTGVIGGIVFFKHDFKIEGAVPYLWGIGIYGLITGLLFKPAIKPVFIFFTWIGLKLNWVMTRIILSIFFFLILAPIGIMMRIFRNDLLECNYDPDAKSYWLPPKREDYKPEYTERLF